MINYLGEVAALGAAFLWASSSTVYGLLGLRIPPLRLNLYKGLIAIALILVTIVLTSNLKIEIQPPIIIWLLISGVVGIGLGDSAYFYALKHLGARKTLLLETLSPPLAGFLAWIYLGETLTMQAWVGILLTVLGVAWVISEGTSNIQIKQKNAYIGIIWGVIAALCQASAAVISRHALVESGINPLVSTLIRLIGGTLIILPLLFIFPQPVEKQSLKSRWKTIIILILTAFASTYLGIWLQQTALKYTQTGIATTLLATSPLFVLPIARLMGEKITIRAIIGVIIALMGIATLG